MRPTISCRPYTGATEPKPDIRASWRPSYKTIDTDTDGITDALIWLDNYCLFSVELCDLLAQYPQLRLGVAEQCIWHPFPLARDVSHHYDFVKYNILKLNRNYHDIT